MLKSHTLLNLCKILKAVMLFHHSSSFIIVTFLGILKMAAGEKHVERLTQVCHICICLHICTGISCIQLGMGQRFQNCLHD